MGANDLQVLALAKMIKKVEADEISASLTEGKYEVDFTIHVQGFIKKGKSYDMNCASKANPWALLAVAMSKLPQAKIDQIVKDAELIAEGDVSQIKDKAEAAIKAIKADTKTPCTGKVTSTLLYKII